MSCAIEVDGKAGTLVDYIDMLEKQVAASTLKCVKFITNWKFVLNETNTEMLLDGSGLYFRLNNCFFSSIAL